jgi:hypothetical protein
MMGTGVLMCDKEVKMGLNSKYTTITRSWLRHYATSRKVAGSSPEEVDISID